MKQASELWKLSDRRVRLLCEQGKIDGVVKQGRSYFIPADSIKPADGRSLRGVIVPQEYSVLFSRIDALKSELNNRRPLMQGELQRLKEEFLVEFTYNSNAIEGNTLTLNKTAEPMIKMVAEYIEERLKMYLEILG